MVCSSGSSTTHSGRPDAPLVERGEFQGRRRVCGIAARRAGRHPAADGGDLRIRQRRVFLERPHADVALDEPRRHLALRGLVADGAGPRPHLLVGQQRHGRDRSGAMALLARALQDRQDVAGERRVAAGRLRERGAGHGQQQRHDRGDESQARGPTRVGATVDVVHRVAAGPWRLRERGAATTVPAGQPALYIDARRSRPRRVSAQRAAQRAGTTVARGCP